MILTLIGYFLAFNTLTIDNSNELCLKLCSDSNINFEQDIVAPFNTYLSTLNIEGNSDMELYLNYLKYLSDYDDEHQLLEQTTPEFITLQQSLSELGLLGKDHVEYGQLTKLIKKVRPKKNPVIVDFQSIYKLLKKNDYNVSAGLTASGLTMALTDHNVETKSYRNLLILTIAPYAITR
jgi:hypothetical protein